MTMTRLKHPMKRVGFVVNQSHPAAPELVRLLGDCLRARQIEFFGEADGAAGLGLTPAASNEVFEEADLCVALGGDGTLLRAARRLGDREIPIFGVHMGALGFMTEITVEDAAALLAKVVEGDFTVQRRVKLDVHLASRRLGTVLNELALNRGPRARIIDIELAIDGRFATRFRADGIIVSTPTGSTGYALSAAGPILDPALSATLITPICPHTLGLRPLVVPSQSQVELCLRFDPDDSSALLTLDGQSAETCVRPLDRLRITRARSDVLLVRNPNVDFFSILRSRLGWGCRP
ncbi:MAG: NAD(+)/NADH kinase [Myxococcales bacterium]|jgi:NAD+ kinase|nr:NAD(+)/NADH kinase [Myxococcales bacterium]